MPLAIAGPGVRGGRVVDDMVSLTDLAPTFLEAGGQPIPALMTGRSLWPVLRATASGQVDPARDAVFTGRERHVAEARADFTSYPQRAFAPRPKYELYDLRADPHETRNLADDPAHAELKTKLEKRLLDELTRTGDPRMIEDGRFFETPPMAGPGQK